MPFIIVFVLGLVVLGAYILVHRFSQPADSPKQFLKRGRTSSTSTLVVCAGDSLTHAVVSADYITLLRREFHDEGYEFVNAGINGDLTYNLLARLDDVIACQPDVVTLLIGTNDVNATFDDSSRVYYKRQKNLPVAPDLEWSAANYEAILSRLKAETSARIMVLSPPVLGEDLHSPINEKIVAFSRRIKGLADRYGADYLPLNEVLREELRVHGTSGAPPYEGNLNLFFKVIVQRYLFKQSWDDISERHGFYLLTDHIHLNDRGAAIIARLIARALPAGKPEGLPADKEVLSLL